MTNPAVFILLCECWYQRMVGEELHFNTMDDAQWLHQQGVKLPVKTGK